MSSQDGGFYDSLVRNPNAVYHNLSAAQLVEEAIRRGEGSLTASGALNAFTGTCTGRSPQDRFIVDDPSIHGQIDWGKVNQAISPSTFNALRERATRFMEGKDLFVFDGYVGADPEFRLPVRVIGLHAWQCLFAQQLFIRPEPGAAPSKNPFTVIHVPDLEAASVQDGVRTKVFVILNIRERCVLIGGTQYAGEIKKSIFSVMNYLLPQQGVLPMHCSANVGAAGDVALFFGLSGTGKTTLSADPSRQLIGDDEHGWSDRGVFNLEGGCYAKCIRLSEAGEPQIWSSIRFGSVLENVTIDPLTRIPDYNDDSVTENTRAAYPVEFIPNAVRSGMGGHPRNVLFLTADASGVLPPISKLSPEGAMYHFLSGYTSRLAGTEAGVGKEPQADFSACFGKPFLPLPPPVYAEMLGTKLQEHGVQCWLVNTGWTGGPYGVGERMNLGYTRAMVDAVLDGTLSEGDFAPDPIFRLLIPSHCPGVPDDVLQPRNTWKDKTGYDRAARQLASDFEKNFAQFRQFSPGTEERGGPML
ncbi:MAG: phosphoenolpyruvate carboxykinase (ATP) [Armatimonadota bacterium]|nr:phosphoenolpyruvate carboxykinase (ATP) [Armatimonadota bacterium]